MSNFFCAYPSRGHGIGVDSRRKCLAHSHQSPNRHRQFYIFSLVPHDTEETPVTVIHSIDF